VSKFSDKASKAWGAYWADLVKFGASNMPASVHFGAGYKAGIKDGEDFAKLLADICESSEKAYETARDQRDELLSVLKELQESASYWSEYDVPLGIVDRINNAIKNAEAAK